jgi:hypothetical protein
MSSRAFLILIVIAGLLLPRPVAAEPPERSVLVLDQSSAGLPFNAAVTNAIRSTINAGSKSPISFYSEYLVQIVFSAPSTKRNLSNSSKPNTVENTSML